MTYALRRGVDGLSSGTRVIVLTDPTVDPVRVRTERKIPSMVHRAWRDHNGQQHDEAVRVRESFLELTVPMDNLVRLRERTR